MMNSFALSFFYFMIMCFIHTEGQTFATNAKIDPKELKCLVCEKSIHELTVAVKKLDPNQKVEVGGHRLDKDGNFKQKEVPQAKSEMVLSEIIEKVCDRMDDYIRAFWKSNGTLTLISMVDGIGIFDKLDIVQDDDLNKSLKYYCEEIVGEYEETIISLFQKETPELGTVFCTKEAKLCSKKSKKTEL